LQAKNDFSIQPAQVMRKIAKARGGQATIYPPFGQTHEDGHWRFATTQAGIAIWGKDVLSFINGSFTVTRLDSAGRMTSNCCE
jgi:hypothetical protein